MTKKEILDYVMENPGNTNVSVLGPMVDAVAGVAPTGKITITENGSDIDVAQYAKADVAVNPEIWNATISASFTGTVIFSTTFLDYADDGTLLVFNGVTVATNGFASVMALPAINNEAFFVPTFIDENNQTFAYSLSALTDGAEIVTKEVTYEGETKEISVIRVTKNSADIDFSITIN